MAKSVRALIMEGNEVAWIIYKGGVRVMWRGYRIYSACGEGRHEDCVSPTTMYLWIYIYNHQYLL